MRAFLIVLAFLAGAAVFASRPLLVPQEKQGQEKQKQDQEKEKKVAKEKGKGDEPIPPKTGDPKKQQVGKTDGKADGKTDGKDDPKKDEPRKKSKEEKEEEVQQGIDPADLRALRSAKEMLEAEKRLRKLIKDGKIKGVDKVLPFEEIASWPYEDGLKGIPKAVKKLDGKKVMMIGFMLPIDEVENIKEFLLVQSLWACCYGQPPDINGTVRVVMKGKARTEYLFDPIQVVGTFKVSPTIEDGFCVDIYQLEAESVSVIK